MKLLIILIMLFQGVTEESSSSEDFYFFIYDSEKNNTLQDVKTADFETTIVQNSRLKRGSYWFKIEEPIVSKSVFVIETPHVNEIKLYDSNNQRLEQLPNARYASFSLNDTQIVYPLYLNANFPLGSDLKFQFYKESEFKKDLKNSFMGMGVFYGIALTCFILTLTFFFILRKGEYMLFSIIILMIALSISGTDNIWNYFNISTLTSIKIEFLGNLGTGLSICIFLLFYFHFKRNKKLMKILMLSTGLVGIISWFLLLFTDSFYFALIINLTTFLSINYVWMLINQIVTGKLLLVFKFLYPFNLLVLSQIYVLHIFNLNFIDIDLFFVATMAIFNFTLIGIFLFYSFYNIKLVGTKRKVEIENYIKQIKELDSYRNIENAEDTYMEALIYDYGLENLEIKVLSEISKGRTNEFIKELFSLTDAELRTTTTRIYEKLGIQNSNPDETQNKKDISALFQP